MVLSNQTELRNQNSFLHYLSEKHNFDLVNEFNEFADNKNPETLKDKIDFIFIEISLISGIHINQLMGTCRKRELVEWRHLGRYICLMNKYGSLSFISRILGVNHATTLHSKDLVNDLIQMNDTEFMDKFKRVKHLLK